MAYMKTIWDDASQTYKNVEESDAPRMTFGDLPSWMAKRTEGKKTKADLQGLNYDWAQASPFYNRPSDGIYRQPTNQSQNQSDTQSYGDPFAQQLQSVKSDKTPQPMSPQVIAPAQTGYTATAEAPMSTAQTPMSTLPLKSMNKTRNVNPYWAYQMR
jgi:hypothetical protein